MNRLRLHVCLDTLWTTFPSNAALLVTAKGSLRRGIESRIDAHRTSFNLAGNSESSGNVGGVHGGCYMSAFMKSAVRLLVIHTAKTVGSIICKLDRLVFVFESPDGNDGSKYLI